MPSELVESSLNAIAEVTDYVANGSFASLKENVQYLSGDGYAILVRLVDHNSGWTGEHVFVDEKAYRFLAKSSLKAGDIVIANVGANAGTVFRVPKLTKPATLGPNAVMVRPRKGSEADNDFLYYYLISPLGQSKLRSITSGSAQPKFNKTDLRALQIALPSLATQQDAASTLLALDRKIALLRETNATLEAIAQALFKSWFVDFDPVRTKAEGRDPVGVPPEVADLFPSEFEDSELGEVPKGWRVGAFADITDVVGGGTPSTKEPAYWEEGQHYWATPKDLSGMDTPVLLETERKITDVGLAKISSGLLPVGTVLMSSRAPIGYLAIAEVPVAVNQGFIAMKPKAGISNLFLLDLLRVQMDEIKSHANGSTFMEISKAAFRPLKVVVPPMTVIQAFDDVARSLYERMVGNVRQIDSLTDLRDALLPRLMSGKLRIPESQEIAEEATA